ncbi:large ribosomal subunit protein mL54 [Maniola hyperantus]|uniref:large ribosomal subunit protein mL54 n=1 Tax=Aphantopus hyperantus TaxID=2795564 RepID=UPI001568A405|nr:39S ribosomal protein L54, mitochondrial [Maniola hyperantus]
MLKILNKLLTSTKATSRIFQSQFINCNSSLCIANFHSNSPNFAVKKTTTAAGGVLGLGKGKKKLSKLGSMEKKQLPVETDPEKLVNYVCGSNIYITGEDVKIKDESEYPDWLWTLNTGKPPRIEDLDPNTKQYWIRVRAAGMRRNNKLRSMRKF